MHIVLTPLQKHWAVVVNRSSDNRRLACSGMIYAKSGRVVAPADRSFVLNGEKIKSKFNEFSGHATSGWHGTGIKKNANCIFCSFELDKLLYYTGVRSLLASGVFHRNLFMWVKILISLFQHVEEFCFSCSQTILISEDFVLGNGLTWLQ